MTVTEELRQRYFDQGFHIMRGAISMPLVEELRAAVRSLVERARRPGGPEIAWIDQQAGLPERLSCLLREELVQPAFVASLEETPIVPFIEGLLQRPVRISLFGMLAGGGGKPYVQGWHRDLGEIRRQEDLAAELTWMRLAVQMNAPLFPDRFLVIVPGSHRRFGTAEEQEACRTGADRPLPNQLVVDLQPGDIVFYYPSFYHRGYNPQGLLRWTLHHAFWAADQPVRSHECRNGFRVLPSFGAVTRRLVQAYLDAMPDGEPANIIR